MSVCSSRNFYSEGYTTTTCIVVVCIISQTFVCCNTFMSHKRAVKKVFMGSFVESYILSISLLCLFKLLIFALNYAILNMPNKLYALIRSTGFFISIEIGISFFRVVHILNLVKMQIPFMWTISRTAYKLVWRQLEFAFFVRWLRLAHFFYVLNRRVQNFNSRRYLLWD